MRVGCRAASTHGLFPVLAVHHLQCGTVVQQATPATCGRRRPFAIPSLTITSMPDWCASSSAAPARGGAQGRARRGRRAG